MTCANVFALAADNPLPIAPTKVKSANTGLSRNFIKRLHASYIHYCYKEKTTTAISATSLSSIFSPGAIYETAHFTINDPFGSNLVNSCSKRFKRATRHSRRSTATAQMAFYLPYPPQEHRQFT